MKTRTKLETQPKGSMEITVIVSDSLVEQSGVVNLPQYASQVLQDALKKKVGQKSYTYETKPSKWANIAQRIADDPDLDDPEFKVAWKKVKEGMSEVHENFEFKHDQ